MDAIWGLSEVTPGAIAASAIYVSSRFNSHTQIRLKIILKARFALSHDGPLQRQGSTSGIDYEGDFITYLRYLVSGRTEKKSTVVRIFRIWNQYFFPESEKVDIVAGVVPTRVVEAAFAALDSDDESQDGSE